MYQGHPDQRWGHISYAQHGDDFMLLNLFEQLGIEKPSFLDIGAHHPVTISNTYLLYLRGSRGVNVEANPNLIAAFKEQRPEDVTVNVGVGPEAGTFPFYMYSDSSGRNTFSKLETESLKGKMTVRQEITVPVVTLQTIVDTHCHGKWPDLLTIDIEGFDYGVLYLTEFPADNRPKIICVETRKDDTKAMSDMLHRKGYWPLIRMGENLFFVDSTLI